MTALAMRTPVLEMWVVYKYPKDFPNDYVVRRWKIDGQELIACEAQFAPTIEAVRKNIPDHLTMLRPMAGDDPCIVETWI